MSELREKLKGREIIQQVLTDQVSQILTELILSGDLKPGEQLVETDLQKQLGVSRSPLREAFRDLENKGLVTIIPRKGTFVRGITRKDIEENFPVRANLEGLAAREAHSRITPAQLEVMQAAYTRMIEAGAAKDSEAYRKHHSVFHDTFIQASGNSLLIGILETLRMHRLWYLVSFRYHREEFQASLHEHKKILELLSSKDSSPSELENTVRAHIEKALEKLFGPAGDEP